MSIHIEIAQTDEQIVSCYPVMAELRPHIALDDFTARIRLQQTDGFILAYLSDEGIIFAVTGFRIGVNLAWGKYLYVDDLVTSGKTRSHGYGKALFQWLVEYAKAEHCNQLHLDSGVQRFGAHRFYLTNRMDITSYHFRLMLP